jgi:hypothetical protein
LPETASFSARRTRLATTIGSAQPLRERGARERVLPSRKAQMRAVTEGKNVSTSSRRKATASSPLEGGEPVTCFCGATDFDYSFVRFPMTHVSRCRSCGLEYRGELKITQPPPRPSSPPQAPPIAFPPFWS